MRSKYWTGTLLAAVFAAPGALAQPAVAPQAPVHLTLHQAALAFGAREAVVQASLSPDGTKLATVEPYGERGTILKILDLSDPAGKPRGILTADGDPNRMNGCHWAGQKRLLCQVIGVVLLDTLDFANVNRIMAINADGKNLQVLKTPGRMGYAYGYSTFGGSIIDWNTGEDGHVLIMQRYFPEFSTGTLIANKTSGLGVDDVDSANLHAIHVEKPHDKAVEYMSDGMGHVRIMGIDVGVGATGYSSSNLKYFYRPNGSSDWKALVNFDRTTRAGFDPYNIDAKLNLVYGLEKNDGRFAAYSISLDGEDTKKLVFARPDVDVGGFATVGRRNHVIGVTYTTDRSEVRYTDPKYKALAAALSKAMPNLPLIRFIDASQDESKLLLWAGSDVDPGHYYRLDRKTGQMEEVALSRWGLNGVTLAPVRTISVKAQDGTSIPAYLTLPPGSSGKNLPAIVMPHGGPSSRDQWGFDWLAQFWANRGYAVLQPNYRGSSGYGDDWFQQNGFKSWKLAIADIASSGRWLVLQGIADPKRLAIFGWSYGGYAALQTAEIDPDLFKAVIAIAPVTDLGHLKEEFKNWSNYLLTSDFIGEGPHIEEGSPARHADRMKAPVLMFAGSYDRNVRVDEAKFMDDQLKDAGKASRLVVYDKLDHYLDDSKARADMLEQSATFLQQSFAAGK